MLDGISPRTARHVNTKLVELGLLRRETNRRALVLVHPFRWPVLGIPKPWLHRMASGKLICTTKESQLENEPLKQEKTTTSKRHVFSEVEGRE